MTQLINLTKTQKNQIEYGFNIKNKRQISELSHSKAY